MAEDNGYKMVVKNVIKIFGNNPKKVIPLLEKGMSKDEILNKTGNTIGVNKVSFNVKNKEIFVVMGLSGSGKSTLIRCLNRLIEPTSGEIYVDGENVLTANKEKLRDIRRHKMNMVFQNFALFPHKTVSENVQFGLEVQKVEKEERRKKAYEALDMVGLKGYEEQYPKELSGGMQQRVGLARALATDPDILLMDEAFSALDPLIRRDMQDQLLELQEKLHKTIIFITHDLDEALKLGDRIAIMKDGHIDQIGTGEEILTNPSTKYVEEFVQDVDRTKVITAENIMKKPIDRAFVKDTPRIAVRKMRKAGIDSIVVTDRDRTLHGIVTIEDALKYVEEGKQDLKPIISEIKKVSPDTSIMDILPLHIDYNHPIAVVDEENKLLGIIVKVSVLSGILGEVN
ncbi:quaternary amine ABC transporter ATP-binding protein [Geotoga petraea]|jgi:glycine betaine/proline transport system ATP-binding protein|uniref:Glycine betaine/L-proline ABC transporter ATP-binding protein n=1 Tax=Geotoga petraea TaxID=28234 RepID=A0A1G6JFG1_9BACT|nr:glycine betaine/L-proline ABC transporter ATP-binding protein [Geotoga petraea]MDK2946025.1 glycine betaine/proline transport system ATP-binding protein [Geotoga sp.]TGG88210.1 glycine betaine/L-proline ABC transporter ATP-binding protein [Geotoga petraea]SDC17459.1 glycine betaine/proline transport system ATP-binding protein [Geotoga petraea]